jgi:hypothetical protein
MSQQSNEGPFTAPYQPPSFIYLLSAQGISIYGKENSPQTAPPIKTRAFLDPQTNAWREDILKPLQGLSRIDKKTNVLTAEQVTKLRLGELDGQLARAVKKQLSKKKQKERKGNQTGSSLDDITISPN